MSDGGAIDPRVVRSRQAILPAATRHFLEHGYLAANMDDIAAAAGVSKRTIYNLFRDKEQLFREVIGQVFDTAEAYATAIVAELSADDIESSLEAVAVELAGIVSMDTVISLRRLVIGEAERFPELAAEYWRRAPGRTISALAERFRQLAAAGILDTIDADGAAEQFAYIVIGSGIDRALFKVDHAVSVDVIEARARAGARLFFKAHSI